MEQTHPQLISSLLPKLSRFPSTARGMTLEHMDTGHLGWMVARCNQPVPGSCGLAELP